MKGRLGERSLGSRKFRASSQASKLRAPRSSGGSRRPSRLRGPERAGAKQTSAASQPPGKVQWCRGGRRVGRGLAGVGGAAGARGGGLWHVGGALARRWQRGGRAWRGVGVGLAQGAVWGAAGTAEVTSAQRSSAGRGRGRRGLRVPEGPGLCAPGSRGPAASAAGGVTSGSSFRFPLSRPESRKV